MESDRCPKCGSPTVIAGHVTGSRSVPADVFVPSDVRLLRLRQGVALDGATFRCCVSCGHLWAGLRPEDLRAFIEAYGDELAKQDVRPTDVGVDDGLPDLPEALGASRGVAEIDALIRAERRQEATRRYRDLTGGTWDQAIDAIRGWRDLTRDQKLVLFGWRPKGVSRDGRAKPYDDPMHDLLLDE
jgi:hypothetical protein